MTGLEIASVVASVLLTSWALIPLQPGARLVERVSDEVVIAASEAAAAVRTAIALRAAIEQEPQCPTVRGGVHAGSVAERGGQYFGGALNLTARVASHALVRFAL